MLVGEGHEVGRCGGVVGLREARERERTGNEFARDGVGAARRLVWMERATIVAGGAEGITDAGSKFMKFCFRQEGVNAVGWSLHTDLGVTFLADSLTAPADQKVRSKGPVRMKMLALAPEHHRELILRGQLLSKHFVGDIGSAARMRMSSCDSQ